MTSTEILLADIEAFLLRTGMKAADFGLLAVRDVAFVYRLRDGRDLRMSTADRVRDFMRAHESGNVSRRRKRGGLGSVAA